MGRCFSFSDGNLLGQSPGTTRGSVADLGVCHLLSLALEQQEAMSLHYHNLSRVYTKRKRCGKSLRSMPTVHTEVGDCTVKRNNESHTTCLKLLPRQTSKKKKKKKKKKVLCVDT